MAVYSKLANGEYAHATSAGCLTSGIAAQYLFEVARHLSIAHDARLRSQDANKRRQRIQAST
ncbi:hypothetical protein SNOG_11022 [Parastagonospora nodorum SN15]|uniref:Uncharacterized protein n=1 Tax=Phaeosphaeria nodorum (strain SN15 / ATCC MYA-4574 / FGSC 10173) TaxID=321614 RepID=Q0UB42_PHANO|nr:hypothetical protein SNOG_11022 [Parastagonospora nodorum SN15]EAT81521.1 hypothetical protein SNOG_11022 [Parastagonospora nodorum SN15]